MPIPDRSSQAYLCIRETEQPTGTDEYRDLPDDQGGEGSENLEEQPGVRNNAYGAY